MFSSLLLNFFKILLGKVESKSYINLNLAWQRFKFDVKNRNFVKYPFEIELIEKNLAEWLKSLNEKIVNGYSFRSMEVCEIPKGKGLVRPGSHLNTEDAIYYTALLGACYKNIYQVLKWSQNVVDYSYILSNKYSEPDWIIEQFNGWRNFRELSIQKIEEGYSYVVITDITGFYENIDIQLLISDLRQLETSSEVINELSKCLNKWAQLTGRGIPQGYSPSDILAKLYLNSIDIALKNKGYIHLRYVDDIRIFCHNKYEAKKVLMELAKLLRKRGLNLQSAKTKIYKAIDAKKIIEGVQPIIKIVFDKLREEVRNYIDPDYVNTIFISKIDEAIINNPNNVSISIIRETFKSNFVDNDNEFDKTLFRFLLNRLKKVGDTYALEYCMGQYERHPEEMHTILDYFKSINAVCDVKESLVNFLESEDAVYDYQNYQIIDWLCMNLSKTDDTLLKLVRAYAFDNNRPYYLRAICRKFLSCFGNTADWENIEAQYSSATSELEKAELICSLNRIEKMRRNSLLGRIKGEGLLIDMASNYVKGL